MVSKLRSLFRFMLSSKSTPKPKKSKLLRLLMVSFALIGSACTQPISPQTRLNAVIDTDMGADDVMAILYLLQAPNVEVKAITVSGVGLVDCESGVRHAQYLISIAGKEGIPIACGLTEPLQGNHAFPASYRSEANDFYGLSAEVASIEASDRTAVELLISTINSSRQKIYLLTLGPLTNIAAAIETDPSFVENIEMITIMGGAINLPGNIPFEDTGIQNTVAEWNAYIDPTAANIVLQAGVSVTLVPLDTTSQVPITPAFYDYLEANHAAPAANLVYELFKENPYLSQGGFYFWDPLAAVLMTDESLASFRGMNLRVVETEGPESGRTVVSEEGSRARVATEVDNVRFEQIFLNILNGNAASMALFAPAEEGYAEGVLLWRFEVGHSSAGTNQFYVYPPIIQGGKIFFAGLDGDFHALDLESGQEIWAFATPGDVYAFSLVTDQTIYFGSTDNKLYAVDLLTGLENWQFETQKTIGNPAVANGLVYVGSEDGSLFALDEQNGQERWRYETSGRTDLSEIFVVRNVVIFSNFERHLYAVDDQTGELRWQVDSDSPIVSVIVAEEVIYFSNQNRQLIALNVETGEESWRSETGESIPIRLIIEDDIGFYVSGDAIFVAVDIQTGRNLWQFEMSGCIPWLPSIGEGLIFLGSDKGVLFAVDNRTGRTLWQFKADDLVCDSIMVSDGKVYTASLDGRLYVLDSRTGEVRWRFETDGIIFSVPAVSENKVYFLNGDGYFYAVQGP